MLNMDLQKEDIYIFNIQDLKELSDDVEDFKRYLNKKTKAVKRVQEKIKNSLMLTHVDLKIISSSLSQILIDIEEFF